METELKQCKKCKTIKNIRKDSIICKRCEEKIKLRLKMMGEILIG